MRIKLKINKNELASLLKKKLQRYYKYESNNVVKGVQKKKHIIHLHNKLHMFVMAINWRRNVGKVSKMDVQ